MGSHFFQVFDKILHRRQIEFRDGQNKGSKTQIVINHNLKQEGTLQDYGNAACGLIAAQAGTDVDELIMRSC